MIPRVSQDTAHARAGKGQEEDMHANLKEQL
jgi:hypothetical protein